jgi:hypothetical protein
VPAGTAGPISDQTFARRAMSRSARVSSLLLIRCGGRPAGPYGPDADVTVNEPGAARRAAGAELGVSAERGATLSGGSPAEFVQRKGVVVLLAVVGHVDVFSSDSQSMKVHSNQSVRRTPNRSRKSFPPDSRSFRTASRDYAVTSGCGRGRTNVWGQDGPKRRDPDTSVTSIAALTAG